MQRRIEEAVDAPADGALAAYDARFAVDLRAAFFAEVLPVEDFFAAVFLAPDFFAGVFLADDFLADDFFAAPFLAGTLPPALRASERPIAIACFLLVTFLPEPPLFSVPCLRSCIVFSTFSDAFVRYVAMVSSLL